MYLVFTRTGTLFSRLIHIFTGSPYSHASISFDMKNLYSFGRKYKYLPMPGCFVEEHLDSGVFAMFPNSKIAVCKIDKPTDIAYIPTEQKYNYVGALFDWAVPIKTNRMYCSQYVNWVVKDFDEICVTPGMLFEKHKKDIIYEGTVKEFLRQNKNLLTDTEKAKK